MVKNSLFLDGCFDKNRLKSLISWSLKNCGEKITIDLVENLKDIGFKYATQAGISLGIDDLKIPLTKSELILEADINIQSTQISHKQAYLTGIEKFQQLIDTWHRTSEILKQDVIHYFKATDILNPVYMMAFSGARGNISQVRQLVGMRGLMSDPQGQILDFPIKSNFREGLTLTEYIISCYGARKGLVDTALKTANSGYLTRRLVDVSHHIIISSFDCKTKRGIILHDIIENGKILVPLQNRLIGRIAGEDIYSLSSNQTSNLNRNYFNGTDKKNKKKLVFAKSLICNSSKITSKASNPVAKQSKFFSVTKKPSFENKVFKTYRLVFNQMDFYKASLETINNNARVLALFFQLVGTYFFDTNSMSVLNFPSIFLKDKENRVFPENQHIIKNYLKKKLTPNSDIVLSGNSFTFYQLLFFIKHISVYYTKLQLIVPKNAEISVNLAAKISMVQKRVLVRSPLTCELNNSLCQLCYGWSLAHGKLVSMGEAVGIIAAQSIGEPGTQLTMRTFHTGGVFSGDSMRQIRAPFDGILQFSEPFQGVLIRTAHGKIAFLTKVAGKCEIYPKEISHSDSLVRNTIHNNKNFLNKKSKNQIANTIIFQIPALTVLFIRNYDYVKKNQVIAEFTSMSTNREDRIRAQYDIKSEIEGEILFRNAIIHTRTKKQKLVSRTTNNLGSMWILSGKIYEQLIPVDIFPQPGDIVNKISIMGQYETICPYNGFIIIPPKKLALLPNPLSRFSFTPQSSFLLKSAKYQNFKTKKFQNQNFNTDEIFLNHTIISFLIQSVQYKKIGYFFSFFNYPSSFTRPPSFNFRKIGWYNLQNQNIRQKKNSIKIFLKNPIENKSYWILTKLKSWGLLRYKIFYNLRNDYLEKPLFSSDYFFLLNSLQQDFQNLMKLKKTFYFQSFPKLYETQTGGIVISDTFYGNEKNFCGEIFCIPEETYLFESYTDIIFHNNTIQDSNSLKNTLSASWILNKKNSKTWINKNNPMIFYRNSQGKTSAFYSKLYGYFEITSLHSYGNLACSLNCFKMSKSTKLNNYSINSYNSDDSIIEFIFSPFKGNPISSILYILKNNLFFTQELRNTPEFKLGLTQSFSKQSRSQQIQKLSGYFLDSAIKHKKINFIWFKNSYTNILQPQFPFPVPLVALQRSLTSKASTQQQKQVSLKQSKNFNENNKIKLKIKPGWVYFPKTGKQVRHKHKYGIQPGKDCFDCILFDQYAVYLECIPFKKISIQNKKNIFEKNSRLKAILNLTQISNMFKTSLTESKTIKHYLITNKKNQLNSWRSSQLKHKKWKNQSLDLEFLTIRTILFFNKNFTLSDILSDKHTLCCISGNVYEGLSLEKYIQKNTFLNFFSVGRQKLYNYEKIYFLENILKVQIVAQADITEIKNQISKTRNVQAEKKFFKITSKTTFKLKKFSNNIKNISYFYSKNRFVPKFFILIRKIKSYSFIHSSQYKQLLSQQNQYLIHSYIHPDQPRTILSNLNQLSWFNKQNSTYLFFNLPTPDFYIKPYLKYKEFKKNSFSRNATIVEFSILFKIPKNYPIKIPKITIISKPSGTKLFPDLNKVKSYPVPYSNIPASIFNNRNFLIKKRNLLHFKTLTCFNVSFLCELKLSNLTPESVQNKTNKLIQTKLLIYSKNSIFNQTALSLTTFSSPYEGEILKIKPFQDTVNLVQSDALEKQKSLILTDEDQISFSTDNLVLNKIKVSKINSKASNLGVAKTSNNQNVFTTQKKSIEESETSLQPLKQKINKNSSVFLGKFVRYGKKIKENLAISESGRVIQIDKSKITLRKAQLILFSSKGLLSVNHRDIIEKNALVLRLFYQRLKTGDIVQGIPKIEQLFEARETYQGELLVGSLHDQLEFEFRCQKQTYGLQEAARRSLEKMQQIIVNNVQKVYQSQGVTIAEKHFEIIVRQMTTKVEIIEAGEAALIPGEHVNLDDIEAMQQFIKSKKDRATYKPIILGITKKSLDTESFISEASFRETTRVLARSATEARIDFLRGLKENVILGHVIPAGTGFSGKIFHSNKPKCFPIKNDESSDIFRTIFFKATEKNISKNSR